MFRGRDSSLGEINSGCLRALHIIPVQAGTRGDVRPFLSHALENQRISMREQCYDKKEVFDHRTIKQPFTAPPGNGIGIKNLYKSLARTAAYGQNRWCTPAHALPNPHICERKRLTKGIVTTPCQPKSRSETWCDIKCFWSNTLSFGRIQSARPKLNSQLL